MTPPAIGRRDFVAALLAAPIVAVPAAAGRRGPRSSVGADGVWRWADGREVALFGVNYNLASASAFRFAKASGVPFERIVAADFAHLKRIGCDALRLSFWGDWETSDGDGGLIANEHLAVLDLIVARAGAAGFACLLSPIVTYDAAWPDALEQPRAGIAHRFKKEVLGSDGAAIVAQARYLRALLARTNPLTGRRYADEPAIVAVEPINEPTHHAADRAGSVRYIDTLAEAVRDGGFDGPIFYNVTQDMAIAPAIAAAAVQGATFAWYPTGLQTGHAVAGNGLLLVDDYAQFGDPALRARAKLVYEFDAADSMASYFYPAMVRAFRGGGAQFAAMFAYDAVTIAAANSEFNDHFLNLAYTPAKAIGALIAAAAMRDLPRGKSYGAYPANMRFGAYRVDDRADLAELADATRFYHSNDTTTRPPRPAALRRIGGCGSSPLVEYDGTGAWFLDRIAAGVWRLEVYPDAALVANPFVFRRPSRKAVRIVHRARRLRVDLPDLRGTYRVSPGVYRLTAAGAVAAADAGFHAPPGEVFAPILRHTPPVSLTASVAWAVRLAVISPEVPRAVTLHLRGDKGFVAVPLSAGRGFDYGGTVAAAAMTPGYLDYYVVIETVSATLIDPPGDGALPGDWDFPTRGGHRVPVVAADAPLVLFDAERDGDAVIVPYGGYARFAGVAIVPGDDGRAVLRFDGAALAATAARDLPAQLGWDGAIDDQGRAIDRFAALAIEGRGPGAIGVILIERDGTAWGAAVPIAPSGAGHVALAALRPVAAAMLPRDFPAGINPYWLRRPAGRGGPGDGVRLRDLQAIQVTLADRFAADGTADRGVVDVARVALVVSPR